MPAYDGRAARSRREAIERAIDFLKNKGPRRFAAAQVQAHDRAEELEKGMTSEQSRWGSPERMVFTLKILDIQAEACLPGDCAAAASFGFKARGIYQGQGDGNGVIEGGTGAGAANVAAPNQGMGEPALFWTDLSAAGMIEGRFTTASASVATAVGCPCTSVTFDKYFPNAKIGNGNYINVWGGGWQGNNQSTGDGVNYYTITQVTDLVFGWKLQTNPGLTVAQAYSMDLKVDDGLPQSGKVTAQYLHFNAPWGTWNSHWATGAVGADGANTGSPNYGPSTAATSGSAATCYDNSGVGGATQQYSLAQNGGAGVNCALSFQFQ
jgi:hypothetical protein